MTKVVVAVASLAVALGGLIGPAAAGAPEEVSVVLHGDLPGEFDCVVMKTSGGSTVDLEVGSIVRALAQTIAHDFAVLYGQLRDIYDSSFIETATVSAVTVDGVEAIVVGQWQLELEQVDGHLSVTAEATGKNLPAPDPGKCT